MKVQVGVAGVNTTFTCLPSAFLDLNAFDVIYILSCRTAGDEGPSQGWQTRQDAEEGASAAAKAQLDTLAAEEKAMKASLRRKVPSFIIRLRSTGMDYLVSRHRNLKQV